MFAATSSCDTADVLRRRADYKRGLVHADLVSQRRADAHVTNQEKRELRVSAKRRVGMPVLCHLAIIFFHEIIHLKAWMCLHRHNIFAPHWV